MNRVARTAKSMLGTTDEMGWGFRTFLDKTPIMKFFATGYVMNATLRISLTSLPVNMACSGICGNIENVLVFLSSGCVSLSSLEFVCVGACFFSASEPKLSPTPASWPFFFNSSVRKF
jgi:hypothetical protein